MPVDLKETRLPGVGVKYGFRIAQGGRLSVILHMDGQREIYYYRRTSDDEPTAVIELHDDEARQLGAILGGAYERPKIVEELEMALGELQIEWIPVPDSSPAIGLTLAESMRKRQGFAVTVVEADKRIAGDVKPSFKWRHASWVEELVITCLTSTQIVKVDDRGATVRDAMGQERLVEADSVILAAASTPAHELFHEFGWMVDELHGAGDALIPRGLEQAIAEGFRLGVRL